MYKVEGNQIYRLLADGSWDLFVTINPNQKDSTVSPADQAAVLIELLTAAP